MDTYKTEPGGKQKLRERNPKWLNDDYVKFIRMGQDYIERAKVGILAYINPHGFLDNPTFRGMRWSLWTTFDTLFVLDLHGNTRRQEMAKDGSKDENIFQIMQGIAINVFLKTKETNRTYGTLYHHELYGSAQKKCRFLAEQFMGTVPWNALLPLTECFSYHFMIPKDVSKVVSYTKGFSLIDLFRTQPNTRANVLSVGLISGWDGMFIDMRAEMLKKRFEDLRRYDVDKLAEMYPTFRSKKQKLRSLKSICQNKEEMAIYPIHYRPFDVRYVLYDRDLLVRPQYAVMRHFLRDNVGLVFSRTVNGAYNWQDIQITRHLVEFGIMATRVGNAAPVAPLFVYERGERISNLSQAVVSQMAEMLAVKVDILSDRSGRGDKLTSWDILDYVLAILHSNRYRRIYEELLKIDYPRVPYPEDADTFWALVEQGKELRNILLLTFEDAQRTSPTLRNKDGRIIPKSEEIAYVRPCSQGNENWNGKVWINERQYFEGISQAAWNFYIGGYKPAQKWLKDRKKTRSVPGRALRSEEVTHYGKMIRALEETMGVMEKIDRILPLD
ncbi:MAG: type ISP restriction/modification enzyme, partial [Myxococcota bacterium]|nr:type ISP restriction/modification enzyme [Myxococcota bacterium]